MVDQFNLKPRHEKLKTAILYFWIIIFFKSILALMLFCAYSFNLHRSTPKMWKKRRKKILTWNKRHDKLNSWYYIAFKYQNTKLNMGKTIREFKVHVFNFSSLYYVLVLSKLMHFIWNYIIFQLFILFQYHLFIWLTKSAPPFNKQLWAIKGRIWIFLYQKWIKLC